MGGYDGDAWYNDVWKTVDGGASWSVVTSSAGWSGERSYLDPVVDLTPSMY